MVVIPAAMQSTHCLLSCGTTSLVVPLLIAATLVADSDTTVVAARISMTRRAKGLVLMSAYISASKNLCLFVVGSGSPGKILNRVVVGVVV